ncbi:MAG: alpha/beta fold hydrolase [Actinobacteria bacterium]|nr:alpha/beta fold hydrolase [Actinomycetota bacterium]MCA1719695.1 alpha/beta fold hydrolase [Actinomycetota bacterium]
MPAPMPVLSGVTHRTVDADGLAVHVAEAGPQDAPPLVLLHGWPQHWWCWNRVVPLLAGDYRLVMPDLRGHGWTDAPPSGYGKEQLATDLLGTMDALGLDRVGLIGHDWGGWTGFLACLRAPERFRGFLALGITHPFQKVDLRVLQSWRGAYQVALSTPVLSSWALRATPRLVEQAVKAGSLRDVGDPRTYGEVFQEPARARASARLYRTFLLSEAGPVMRGRYRDRRLTVPTRLVGGSGDPVITSAFLKGYEDHADDLTVEVLEGVGHFIPEEAPDVVTDRARQLFT